MKSISNVRSTVTGIAFGALLFVTAGCEKEEVGPRMLIEDTDGLDISLEWSTGRSIEQAKDEINIDLYLIKGRRTIQASVTSDFEYIELLSNEADGEYDLRVRYTNITRRGTFLFNINGKSRGRTLRFSGEVHPIEQSEFQTALLRIHKSGDEFSIVQLD